MASTVQNEKEIKVHSGWVSLIITIVIFALSILFFVLGGKNDNGAYIVLGSILTVIGIIILAGFFNLAPNQAAVLSLFGDYKGTVRQTGILWTNPFYSKKNCPSGHAISTEKSLKLTIRSEILLK